MGRVLEGGDGLGEFGVALPESVASTMRLPTRRIEQEPRRDGVDVPGELDVAGDELLQLGHHGLEDHLLLLANALTGELFLHLVDPRFGRQEDRQRHALHVEAGRDEAALARVVELLHCDEGG